MKTYVGGSAKIYFEIVSNWNTLLYIFIGCDWLCNGRVYKQPLEKETGIPPFKKNTYVHKIVYCKVSFRKVWTGAGKEKFKTFPSKLWKRKMLWNCFYWVCLKFPIKVWRNQRRQYYARLVRLLYWLFDAHVYGCPFSFPFIFCSFHVKSFHDVYQILKIRRFSFNNWTNWNIRCNNIIYWLRKTRYSSKEHPNNLQQKFWS